MKLVTSKMASLAFFVVILSIYIVEIDKGTKGSAEKDFISKSSMYMSVRREIHLKSCYINLQGRLILKIKRFFNFA